MSIPALDVKITEPYIRFTSTWNPEPEAHNLNVATLNALRRSMVLFVECWGFDHLLDQEDYPFLTDKFGLKNLKQGREQHTVLIDNTRHIIPVLSHRSSRIPIMTSDDTTLLLQSNENRKVYFILCDNTDMDDLKRFSRPRVNESNVSVRLYIRDFEPVVYVRSEHSDSFEYSAEESSAVKKNMEMLFPYNLMIAFLDFQGKANILLKPSMGRGAVNCKWTPCTMRWRFSFDPRWPDLRPVMSPADGRPNTILRKVKGQMGFKEIFLTDPITRERYNKFGRPYSVTLIFDYNGKMGCVDATQASIREVLSGISLFQDHYNSTASVTADSIPSSVSETSESIVHKKIHRDTQTMFIPLNTDDNILNEHPELIIITDDTIANMLVYKLLEIMDVIIGDNLEWWSQTAISYKRKHPLIKQCIITVPIPLHNTDGSDNEGFISRFRAYYGCTEAKPDYHHILINDACEKMKKDMGIVRAAVDKALMELQ